MSRVQRTTDLTISLLFITMIVLPTAGALFHRDHSTVNAHAAPFPDFRLDPHSLRAFPRQFKAYFKENFGFQSALTTLNGLLKYRLLGMSSSSRVVLGSKDWLYFNDERVMDDFRRLYPFTTDEVDRWVAELMDRQRFCEERDIPYVFTISPNKSTICPDHMPEIYWQRSTVSRLDQLVEGLGAASTAFPLVDVRGALRSHPRRDELYFRTDTHWNSFGAFVACREIVSELKDSFPDIQIQGERSLTAMPDPGSGGDLARFMGLKRYLVEESLRPADWTTRRVMNEDKSVPEWQARDIRHVDRQVLVCPEGEIERGVIFHDSYGMSLVHPLAVHFKRAVFIWSNEFLAEVVDREKPDVVIQQIVERRLMTWMPGQSVVHAPDVPHDAGRNGQP